MKILKLISFVILFILIGLGGLWFIGDWLHSWIPGALWCAILIGGNIYIAYKGENEFDLNNIL